MKQQTAVEWLGEEIKKFNTVITKEYLLLLIEQAKEMEKKQIMESFKHGELPPLFVNYNAEQYYNETFKSE